MSEQQMRGWGRSISSTGQRVQVQTASAVPAAVRGFGSRGGIGRAMGRSYGDQAQRGGGHVVDLRPLRSIDPPDAGVVVCGAGSTIAHLLERIVPAGWFVPVTPGTRAVSVGGAIAADIHGKNHHCDGTFGSHLDWMEIVVASGETVRCSPEVEPDLFWATLGGMGLTGIVTRAAIRLLPIETSTVLVDTTRIESLPELFAAMRAADETTRYSVAWVDCLGARRGRSVLTTGRFATRREVASALAAPSSRAVPAPLLGRRGVLNATTMRAFNAAWFRVAPQERVAEPQSIGRFFHPLDGVADWPRLYGAAGFLQWQFVVPDDAAATVTAAIDALADARIPAFLAVLKRFGPANPAPMSFPTSGWTLAVDIPAATPNLDATLDRLDQQIAAVGGRVYLAKDARLDPRLVPMMYPRLDEWRAVREAFDPDRRFMSDMAARLRLPG